MVHITRANKSVPVNAVKLLSDLEEFITRDTDDYTSL
jgi:hypothetical protein